MTGFSDVVGNNPALNTAVREFAGPFASFALGEASSYLAASRQKDLFDYQTDYRRLKNRMLAAGITPAAAAQGLSGSPGNSMPSASPGAYSPSDIMSSVNQARDIKSLRDRREVENEYDRLKMNFEPTIWKSQVASSFAQALNSLKQGEYYGSMKDLTMETERNIRLMRPWQIATLYRGLVNASAEYDEILSRTNLNRAETDKKYAEWFNEQLRGFALQFENDLRLAGFNPNLNFEDNVKTMIFANPRQFKTYLGVTLSAVSNIDNKLKDSLGEHYKRNILIGAGLHYLRENVMKHKDHRAARFHDVASGVGSLIPLTGSRPSQVKGFRRY